MSGLIKLVHFFLSKIIHCEFLNGIFSNFKFYSAKGRLLKKLGMERKLLVWNPKEFGGIESIRVPCNLIWLPDIVLYNK